MNPAIPWILLFAPLASAALITLFTRRWRGLSAGISVAACLTSLACALLVFAAPADTAGPSFPWLSAGGLTFSIGLTLDGLARAMLLVVTGIGSLIHIYSLGYMRDDAGKSRYFAGLSLFMFSMLGIVLSDNFVMMFLFWELVGVSSYILIGHWFDRPTAAEAAKKAFLTNRIGDFGFMIGILMLWVSLGTVAFVDLKAGVGALAQHPGYLAAATLLVFCGAVGKSAQFPLHVWLPDAMEGPTPVSALIHAATMVAAGVYMLARVAFLIEASALAQTVIAGIGITTALGAALMATQQNDIKRILAYSTLSQLGYMVLAAGMAASTAAMFHLITHAFFKALLFLGAGAVIHALHHEQDIWKMGGLAGKMKITAATFAVGTLALIGCPGLAGFFSKDAILLAALHHSPVLFWLAIATAFLTAFYMTRLVVVAFLGKGRSEAAGHAHEVGPVMALPLLLLAIPSVIGGYGFFINPLLHVPHHDIPALVPGAALTAFAAGVALAFVLYRGRETDPILIPLFRDKFRVDEAYAVLIRYTQELAAKVLDWADRWILDGLIVRGLSGLAWGAGYLLRCLQVGNLQAYAFLFGLGVVAVLYWALS